MNTRDIANKLNSYADLLDAELSRANAMYRIQYSDSIAELRNILEEEIKAAREMAAYLWDKKESI